MSFYTRQITITNNDAIEYTNLEVKIDFDCTNVSDGTHIKFYNTYDETLISHYLESGAGTGSGIIWVKLPTLTASSSVTLRAEYGTDVTDGVSSQYNVFHLWDDFDTDTSANYNLIGTPTWDTANSRVRINAQNEGIIHKTINLSDYEVKLVYSSEASWATLLPFGRSSNNTGGGNEYSIISSNAWGINISKIYYNTSELASTSPYIGKTLTLRMIGTTISFVEASLSVTDNLLSSGYMGVYQPFDMVPTSPRYIENLRVRILTTNDPTISLDTEINTYSISSSIISTIPQDLSSSLNVYGINTPRFYIDGVYYGDYILYFNSKVSHKDIGYFTAKLIGLETGDLTHIAEGKSIALYINGKVPFVGKIEKITPSEDYTWEISGNGFIESMLYNQQVNPTASTTTGSGYGRPQYDVKAVNTVVSEQLSGSGVTLVTDGTYTYPNVTIRADFDNKLSFLNGCSDLTDLIWYVKYGTVTKSGAGSSSTLSLSTPQYYLVPDTYLLTSPITGLYTSSPKTAWGMTYTQQVEEFSEETDLEQCWNSVYALGYGDGINQLYSRMFDSTNNRTYLTADLSSSGTSATVSDGSVLPASGNVWIGVERCAYTRSGNTLTLTRSTADSSVTIGGISYAYKKAYAHRKGIYVQDSQYGESNYESSVGTSIETYGLKQHSVTDKRIIDQDSLDWFCQRVFDNHFLPPGRIFVTMNDPNQGYLEDFEIYQNYSLYDPTITGVDGTYTLYSKEYTYDSGYFTAKYEFSNVTFDLMKILRETKATQDSITKYMQGSTNIYQVNQAENCDATHPLEMKFFIPGDTVALNKLKLNFKIDAYRAYETTTTNINVTNQDLIGSNFASWFSLSFPYAMATTSKINSWSKSLGYNYLTSDGSWYYTGPTTYIPTAICSGSCGDEISDHGISSNRYVIRSDEIPYGDQVVYDATLDYDDNSFTWASAPNYTSTTIPNQESGSFYKTRFVGYLANETNQSRTWNWELRLGSISGTVLDSGSWNSTPFTHITINSSTTSDYTGQSVFMCITGNIFNTTSEFDGSFFQLFVYTLGTNTTSHNHAITYGIYEESYTSPSIQVHVKKEGGAYSLVGTYTSDQSNLDITSLFDGTKDTWYYVKFTPNQRQRLDSSLFVQLFINSR